MFTIAQTFDRAIVTIMASPARSLGAEQLLGSKSLFIKDLAHQLEVDFLGPKQYIEGYSSGSLFLASRPRLRNCSTDFI